MPVRLARLGAFGGALIAALALAAPAGATTYDATTATFDSVLAGANNGDTVVLTSGDYGTFTGTDKAVTIQAAGGATAEMQFDFGTDDHAFTIDGVVDAGGLIDHGTHDITIRNTSFSSSLKIVGLTDSNVLLDSDQFLNIEAPPGSSPARLHLNYGCSDASGITVQRSLFAGGGSDGVQTGCALTVQDNEFRDIVENPTIATHTDAIQCGGGCAGGLTIRRNWVHLTTPGVTQGITAYDTVEDALIEDNVVDINRAAGIEWYSDTDSVIRHNTVVTRPRECGGNTLPCGIIDVSRKLDQPVSTGTVVQDNIAARVENNNGSTLAVEDYNLLEDVAGSGAHDLFGAPTYVGGATPATLAGYALTAGSTGKAAASDSTDIGARVGSFAAAPQTTVTSGPSSTTTSTSATLAFHADLSGSSFECSLDGADWTSCTSTKSYSSLGLGHHVFSVRATGVSGLVDATPATTDWTIVASGLTYVGETETAWTTTSPKTTSSISVQSGDVLVAYGLTEDQAYSLSISGGSLTWTQRQLVNVANYGRAYVWTATASTTGTMTVTFTRSGGTGAFGGDVLVLRGSTGGVGASAKANTTGAPSLSLTTTAANSAIVVAAVDWNAVDGSSRTWRTGAGALTETTYSRTPSTYTVYGGIHQDAGAIGAKTLGLSAPSGQQYSIVAVEVKP